MGKRFIYTMIAIIGLSLSLSSCSDDDDSTPISASDLPAQAQTFITEYFPLASISSVQTDADGYDVTLSSGTTIEFNLSGGWTDVDAPAGMTIPTGFYPMAIDNYVNMNYPAGGINEISQEAGGYEVELISGTDLYFGPDGSFLGYY